jgi:hypothetical protein
MLLALEVRGAGTERGGVPPAHAHAFAKALQDHNVIHCVDSLKGEKPAYESDTLYTRIFGRGEHNTYQPDDDELKFTQATSARHGKAYVTFHGARMYSDAARMITYGKTGEFPPVTKFTGLESLKSVLEEDAKFPTTRQELVKDQGWKLYDTHDGRKARAEDALQIIPEKAYGNVNDVVKALHDVKGGQLD